MSTVRIRPRVTSLKIRRGVIVASESAFGLSNATPAALGTASAGTGTAASRDDHVHPTTGLVLTSRTISTTAPLTGGGDLSANRTLAVSAASETSAGVVELATSAETTAGLAVQASDTRLSNARTPTAHASTHATGGSDPVSPASIGAEAVGVAAAGLAAHVAAADPHTQYILESREGAANGIATLDSGGKVPIGQLPDTVVGAVDFQGLWNALTNSPDLPASSPTKGDYYKVSVAGSTSLGGITDWQVGDWAIYQGASAGWGKVDQSETVSSVFGRTGAIVAVVGDYSAFYQPLDADLTAIAALGSTGLAVRTATDTWAQRSLAEPAAGLTITNPAGVAGNPTFALANDLAAVEGLAATGIARRTATDTWTVGTTVSIAEGGTGATTASAARTALGLAIGSDVQAYDAELAAIAGLTSAADRVPYFTGLGSAELATFTPVGRTIVATVTAIAETVGGTAQSTWTLGDLLYSSAANTLAKLAGNTSATKKFLTQTGTGSVSAAPAWATIAAADLPIATTSSYGAVQLGVEVPIGRLILSADFEEAASVGTIVPGLTWTPAAAGIYQVKLTGSFQAQANTTGLQFRLDSSNLVNGSLNLRVRGANSTSAAVYMGFADASTSVLGTTSSNTSGNEAPFEGSAILTCAQTAPDDIDVVAQSEVNGSWIRIPAGRAILERWLLGYYYEYTSSTSVTVPSAMTQMQADVWAGGGGGGTAGVSGGGGGGAGAFSRKTLTVTPGTTITITVGAGGAVATDGGDSSVALPSSSNDVLAKAGLKGANGGATQGAGGAGGAAGSGVGTTKQTGGAGGGGGGVVTNGGGGGGSAGSRATGGAGASAGTAGVGSAIGGATNSQPANGGTGATAGAPATAATVPGAGGGGASTLQAASAGAGGAVHLTFTP